MTRRLPVLEVPQAIAERPSALQLRVEFGPAADLSAAVIRFQIACDIFSQAACMGAFASSAGLRNMSVFRLEAPAFSEGSSLQRQCAAVGLDAAAFQFLRNMMLGWLDEGVDVRRISVLDPHARELPRLLPPIEDRNEIDAYPRVPPPCSVQRFTFSPSEFSKSRRVLIEFPDFPEPRVVAELEQCAACWYDLLETGAFCEPFGTPAETIGLRGSLSRFDSTTIELHVRRYIGSEVGFNVLAGMLDKFSSSTFPISSIEVD